MSSFSISLIPTSPDLVLSNLINNKSHSFEVVNLLN